MKTMIAIPCMDTVQTEFASSLMNLQRVGSIRTAFLPGSLIYAARTNLGRMAVSEKCDYVLWIDSDMVFPDTLLIDLMKDMEGRDIVSAICHMRRAPFTPVLWKKLRLGETASQNESEGWPDYPRDGIFEVEGCGFGCVLMRTEVLQTVIDKYHELFAPLPGYGEDLSFCIRARGCGYKIHADPAIQVGHKASTIVTDETFQAFAKANPEAVKA